MKARIFSKKGLLKIEKIIKYLIWFLLGLVLFMKFILLDFDYIIRIYIYIGIYILFLLLILNWVITIKIKGFWFEGNLELNNLFIYIGQIFLIILPIWFWPYFFQSFNYLTQNSYQTIQGELIDKDSTTFAFSQWIDYKIRLKNGEIKSFNYLFPTKRANIGDWIELKIGNNDNNQIIITIDKIEKRKRIKVIDTVTEEKIGEGDKKYFNFVKLKNHSGEYLYNVFNSRLEEGKEYEFIIIPETKFIIDYKELKK